MHDLLDWMFWNPNGQVLSDSFRRALADIAFHIPPLLAPIQGIFVYFFSQTLERLLNLLSMILSGEPYRTPGSPATYLHSTAGSTLREIQNLELKDPDIFVLALNTLGSFDFSGHELNEFVRSCVVMYLDDENMEVRKAAALTCCACLIRSPKSNSNAGGSNLVKEREPNKGIGGMASWGKLDNNSGNVIVNASTIYSSHLLSETLEKLLTVGIADPGKIKFNVYLFLDPSIRHTVLSALDERFDPYLSHPENIRALFVSLHDEVYVIREVSMLIIGRITTRNPAYVLPALRRTLIQLLTELEYSVVR